MWLIPFSPGLDHVVMIHFDRAQSIAGLRLWNYNKSPEDTYRGVSRAERSPLSGRQHDEWLVWVLERSINPPEPSKWRGVTSRERTSCVSCTQGSLGNCRACLSCDCGSPSHTSRVVVPAMGLLSVEHWRRCYEAVCVPSSFHRVLILPLLTAPPLRVLRRRGKSCHSLGNYIARVWSSSAKHRTHFLFQLLEKRQGWQVASECV